MAEGGTNSEGPPSIGNVITQTPAEYRTLLVQGLAPEISNELIELIFENPKYGGGGIENFSRESDTQARIVYNEHGSKISFYYRPQRSCGKVIFLHLSVILFKGGVWQTPP